LCAVYIPQSAQKTSSKFLHIFRKCERESLCQFFAEMKAIASRRELHIIYMPQLPINIDNILKHDRLYALKIKNLVHNRTTVHNIGYHEETVKKYIQDQKAK